MEKIFLVPDCCTHCKVCIVFNHHTLNISWAITGQLKTTPCISTFSLVGVYKPWLKTTVQNIQCILNQIREVKWSPKLVKFISHLHIYSIICLSKYYWEILAWQILCWTQHILVIECSWPNAHFYVRLLRLEEQLTLLLRFQDTEGTSCIILC